jgi:hypothetical protein
VHICIDSNSKNKILKKRVFYCMISEPVMVSLF